MLPLTTHCKFQSRLYERYALIEYLAYRLYRLLTENSLHARLLHITYVDTETEKSMRRFGFFTEHFDRLAARTDKVFHRENEIDLSKIGDELIIKIGNFKKNIVLPRAYVVLEPLRARLEEDYLLVEFGGSSE